MFKMTKTSEHAGREIHSLSKTNVEMHSSAISIPPKTDWLLRRKFPKEAETHLNRPFGWMCGIQFQEFRTASKLLHFLMTKSVAEMQTVHLSASGFLLTNDQQMDQMASLVSLLCKKLTELKNFSFGLHTLNTSDKGVALFEEAIYQICRSLAQLKSLSITIDWCKDVDDDTLSFVASEITKYQKKLQKLSLSFSRNDDITNKGIEILANRITRRLIHLQELKFDFSYCPKVTDEGFIALITFISTYCHGLRRLELSFVRCENLTAKGMNVFKSKIILLVNLRELFLDFSWCTKVTGELDDLRTQVTENLKGLKRFELN